MKKTVLESQNGEIMEKKEIGPEALLEEILERTGPTADTMDNQEDDLLLRPA